MAENLSLKRIYAAMSASIARTVSRIVPPREIEDVVQETYVRFCQIEDKKEIRHPRSFLMKVARNVALDYAKRADTRLNDSISDDDMLSHLLQQDEDHTYNTVAAKEEFANFCEAVRALPQQCRRVFVLKKVYGYSQREIARELGLSESTVEKHIANGIRRCSDFMSRFNQSSPSLERGAPVKARVER